MLLIWSWLEYVIHAIYYSIVFVYATCVLCSVWYYEFIVQIIKGLFSWYVL